MAEFWQLWHALPLNVRASYIMALGSVVGIAAMVSLVIDETWRWMENRAREGWSNDMRW